MLSIANLNHSAGYDQPARGALAESSVVSLSFATLFGDFLGRSVFLASLLFAVEELVVLLEFTCYGQLQGGVSF